MIRLPYNSAKLNNDLWKVADIRSYYIQSQNYHDTQLVQWLEEHVGKMYEKVSGEKWHGDGWSINNDISKSALRDNGLDFYSYVAIEKELSEELQTEFLLRFS